MSAAYLEASWLRRLMSLARPAQPITPFAQNVNIVNDGSYRSSREHAPCARTFTTFLTPGAGEHAYLELTGSDTKGAPIILLHELVGSALFVNLTVIVGTAPIGSLTTVSRAAIQPVFQEQDEALEALLFAGTIATANIPATFGTLPVDWQDDGAVIDGSGVRMLPGPLGFAAIAPAGHSIFAIGPVAQSWAFDATWQAMRT